MLVYAADADSPFHAPARRFLEESRAGTTPWHLSWGICYEFLRVVTHPRVFRSPWSVADGWRFIDTLLSCPSLTLLVAGERHQDVAAATFRELPFVAGNLVHDAATAILMREHGLRRICTRDTDFHRFPFLEVHDPVANGLST